MSKAYLLSAVLRVDIQHLEYDRMAEPPVVTDAPEVTGARKPSVPDRRHYPNEGHSDSAPPSLSAKAFSTDAQGHDQTLVTTKAQGHARDPDLARIDESATANVSGYHVPFPRVEERVQESPLLNDEYDGLPDLEPIGFQMHQCDLDDASSKAKELDHDPASVGTHSHLHSHGMDEDSAEDEYAHLPDLETIGVQLNCAHGMQEHPQALAPSDKQEHHYASDPINAAGDPRPHDMQEYSHAAALSNEQGHCHTHGTQELRHTPAMSDEQGHRHTHGTQEHPEAPAPPDAQGHHHTHGTQQCPEAQDPSDDLDAIDAASSSEAASEGARQAAAEQTCKS